MLLQCYDSLHLHLLSCGFAEPVWRERAPFLASMVGLGVRRSGFTRIIGCTPRVSTSFMDCGNGSKFAGSCVLVVATCSRLGFREDEQSE